MMVFFNYFLIIGSSSNPAEMPYDPICDLDGIPPNPPLKFDSLFESGNLQRAIMIGPNEYDLTLRNDTRSNVGGQVFYYYIIVVLF